MGVLLGYTARVNPKALGYEVVSLTGIDVESENLLAVAQEIAKKPYSKSVCITTGDHAIMVEIWEKTVRRCRRSSRKYQAFQELREFAQP